MIATLKMWMKIAAVILFAVLFPTLTLAEETVENTTVNQITSANPNADDFVLPTRQVDVAQSIPLGPLPADRIDGSQKPTPPAATEVESGETEEVEVTAEPEQGEIMSLLETLPVALTGVAILAAILSIGAPF